MMENKHFISFNLDGVNLETVPDDVLMAHIRIIAHRLDKVMQICESTHAPLNPQSLTPLTFRLEAANKRFSDSKPELEWANMIHEKYQAAILGRLSLSYTPKASFAMSEEAFDQLLTTRRSVRMFTNDPIPDDLLKKVIGYGLWAPSNCNVQAVRYILAKTPCVREQLEINGFSKEMGFCTLAIVADYRFYPDGDIDSPIHDSAAAIQNILLACHYYGLGACYISDKGVNTAKRREALGIENDYEKVTAFLWIGQYEKAPGTPTRRELSEVLAFK